jgi:hypothetical protein
VESFLYLIKNNWWLCLSYVYQFRDLMNEQTRGVKLTVTGSSWLLVGVCLFNPVGPLLAQP